MTAVHSDPSSYDLSRLYGTTAQPFRFKRSTVVAIGVAVAFHAGVGFYVVKSHFEPARTPYVDDRRFIVDTFRPDKPPPPPIPDKILTKTPPPAAPNYHDPVIPTQQLVDPLPVKLAENTHEPVGPVVTLDPDPTPAPTPSIPKPDPIIRNPTWLKKPTADQVSSLYPTRAVESGVAGGATLLCEVMDSGAVNNCAVIDESPKGYRFGNAALAMSKYFRLNPRTVDGAAQTGAKVRIPIVFNLG